MEAAPVEVAIPTTTACNTELPKPDRLSWWPLLSGSPAVNIAPGNGRLTTAPYFGRMNDSADHPVTMEEILRRIRERYVEEERLKERDRSPVTPKSASVGGLLQPSGK